MTNRYNFMYEESDCPEGVRLCDWHRDSAPNSRIKGRGVSRFRVATVALKRGLMRLMPRHS